MKIFLMLLLMSSAEAVTLGQYNSSPDGSSVRSFNVDAKKATLKKESNFFDSEKSYSLGSFSLKKMVPLAEEAKKLEKTLAKIKEVDDFLKKKDSDFNDFSDKTPHSTFFMLNEYRVSQGSDLYPELTRVLEKLQKLEWQQDSGIKLSADYKTMSTIKDGKEIKKEAFDFRFHCKNEAPPTICSFKDLGILFVE